MEPDMWILDLQDIEKDTGHIIRHKFVKMLYDKGETELFFIRAICSIVNFVHT